MNKVLTTLTLSVFLMLSGCASITGNTSQSISVQTKEPTGAEVVGANCELTNSKGKWFVITPGTVGISRSNDNMQLLCRKDGYEPGRNGIVSDTKGMMFGNIIFGGGIGAIVDHTSGAAYEYPSIFQVIMTKLQTVNSSNSNTAINSQPVSSSAVVPNSSIDQKLIELKNLFDKQLISNEAYLEQQRIILQKQ
jgi:hypothetical protein